MMRYTACIHHVGANSRDLSPGWPRRLYTNSETIAPLPLAIDSALSRESETDTCAICGRAQWGRATYITIARGDAHRLGACTTSSLSFLPSTDLSPFLPPSAGLPPAPDADPDAGDPLRLQ